MNSSAGDRLDASVTMEGEDQPMLFDHFHAPLDKLRNWTGFFSALVGKLAVAFNDELPAGWFAEPLVEWQACDAADNVEVRVFQDIPNPSLAGVVELVAPSNKADSISAESFVTKCHERLSQNIGVVMVDLVTKHRANLHTLLLDRIDEPGPQDDPLYSSAYHPVKRNGDTQLDIWYEPLAVGEQLLSMPLFLKNGPRARVNLADTYRQTLRNLRYPANIQSAILE